MATAFLRFPGRKLIALRSIFKIGVSIMKNGLLRTNTSHYCDFMESNTMNDICWADSVVANATERVIINIPWRERHGYSHVAATRQENNELIGQP